MNAQRTLLLIEDDLKIAALIRLYAEPEGFRVVHCTNGEEGLNVAETTAPDMVILDRMLPELEGFEILKKIRQKSAVPVLFLTARGEEVEKIVGLELGADDYLTKPFSPKELMARLKAIWRRTHPEPVEDAQTIVTTNALRLDPSTFTAQIQGKPLKLSLLEFKLLHTLAGHPERIFSREQLMEALYHTKSLVFDRTIDAHIKNLRKKLKDDPKKPRYIESVFGIGYKFIQDIPPHAPESTH